MNCRTRVDRHAPRPEGDRLGRAAIGRERAQAHHRTLVVCDVHRVVLRRHFPGFFEKTRYSTISYTAFHRRHFTGNYELTLLKTI